ncbi:MAG: polyphosphate kinase 2 family protein, partial [Marinirhabdus sp.]
RLLRRLDKPNKNWKFSAGDLDERDLWDSYQKYYGDAINRTSKKHAPWYTIPADNKPGARYIVASILLQELQKYTDIKEPALSPKTKAMLQQYRDRLIGNK